MQFTVEDGYSVRRLHTCKDVSFTPSVLDVSDDMEIMVDELAIANPAMPARTFGNVYVKHSIVKNRMMLFEAFRSSR